jgi:hypothetical protein
MGHKDVRVTLKVYSRAVKRRSKLSGAYLAEFDRALAWAALSTPEKAPAGSKSFPRPRSNCRIWLEK